MRSLEKSELLKIGQCQWREIAVLWGGLSLASGISTDSANLWRDHACVRVVGKASSQLTSFKIVSLLFLWILRVFPCFPRLPEHIATLVTVSPHPGSLGGDPESSKAPVHLSSRSTHHAYTNHVPSCIIRHLILILILISVKIKGTARSRDAPFNWQTWCNCVTHKSVKNSVVCFSWTLNMFRFYLVQVYVYIPPIF
jgi:hypothetical protein